jgi:hypothetical protein
MVFFGFIRDVIHPSLMLFTTYPNGAKEERPILDNEAGIKR